MMIVFALVVFLMGAIAGVILTVLCQIQKAQDYKELTLIPITLAEPLLDTHCIVQVSGKLQENITAHSAILLAEYCDEGWILGEFPEAEDFTVEAWCYTPDPIKEVDA